MKKYYKTNAPEVMAAIDLHETEAKEITAAGKAFAAHFGGKLLVSNSIHGYRVAGMKFDPKKPTRLWTCPGDSGEQRPRQSIVRATPEEKTELADLKANWKDRFPTVSSDFAPVMKAMGTDWGHCCFNGGFGMFQFGEFIYVVTGAKLADCMVEIMGSEYEQQAAKFGFQFVRLQSMGFADLARMKKGFPGNGQQFCTAWLKGLPFLNWIDEVDPKRKTVVMIGKRRVESEDRKDTPEWVEASEYHGDRKIWHALYMHTDDQRNALLRRMGMEPLPHRSDECSPCVNANRDDLRRLPEKRIEMVEALEAEIGKPMFRSANKMGAQGIREVILWAKSPPGKFDPKQYDIFGDQGCGSPFGCGL